MHFMIWFGSDLFGMAWLKVQSITYNLEWLHVKQKLQSIVQFNVIQHKSDNTTESNLIGCGTAPGHLVEI